MKGEGGGRPSLVRVIAELAGTQHPLPVCLTLQNALIVNAGVEVLNNRMLEVVADVIDAELVGEGLELLVATVTGLGVVGPPL